MPDVYPYQPTTQGQQLMEARCPGVYRVQGPESLPDDEGFCGWVEVLYYTRDMQGKQVDSARRVRVNPGLLTLRAPGRIFYGGGRRDGQCAVERLDGAALGEAEHFLTQYIRRPQDTKIPEGARAVVVEPIRAEAADPIPLLRLSFYVDGIELVRHSIRSGGCRILRGGAASIRVDTWPYPNHPDLYWAFHWVMDL
ncbi:MAG TPA: hypothetical protein VLS89_14810 [Candidatus Nanopelagicales bacterium]|nr:hypothetical protein [Candidatus Nanopelagicales bacterium]